MKVVLSIAGSDSGGGAGIQADIKTFEAHEVFGTTAITCVTAQNTLGVWEVFELPTSIVSSQLEAVADDFTIAAIKIGMLGNAEIIECVAEFLRARMTNTPVVLDPVMAATSGDPLLKEEAIGAVKQQLIPLATVVTPNAHEAALLTGRSVKTIEDAADIAGDIQAMGSTSVLVKGGHLEMVDDGKKVVDVFLDAEGVEYYKEEYIETKNTHGTGCTLSSAIAANIANGHTLRDSVQFANWYVHHAIKHAPGLGKGHGPLFHKVQLPVV